MGLFNNFPYTDFHRLNLDWILKFTKSVRDRLDLIDAAVLDAQSARDRAEAAQTDAESARDIAMQAASDAEDFKNSAEGAADGAAASASDASDAKDAAESAAAGAADAKDAAVNAASYAEDYKDAAAQSASDASDAKDAAEDAKDAAEDAQTAAEAAAAGINLDGVIRMQGKALEVFTEQSAPPTIMPGCVAFDCDLFAGIINVSDMPVCMILPRGSHSTSTDYIRNSFGFASFYARNPNNNHLIPCFQVFDTVTGAVPTDGTMVHCDVFVFPYAKNSNIAITGYVPS